MEYIQVNFSDITKVLVSLLFVSCSLLVLWTLIAPLEWTRTYRGNTDIFLRLTDSYGECRGESAVFAALLVAVNFCFLILGSWQAAITRHVETEYKESQFINLSLFSILQAWMMGIAILSVTYDDPQARFYVMSGIIFVTSACSLCFVFAPKILALRDDIRARGKKAYLERHRSSGKLKLPREEKERLDAGSVGGESRDVRSHVSSESEPLNEGARVLHNPKSSKNLLAAGGRTMSRAQMQVIELAKSQNGFDGLEDLSESHRQPDHEDVVPGAEESSSDLDMAGGEVNASSRLPITVEEDIEDSSSGPDENENALWANLEDYIGRTTGHIPRSSVAVKNEKTKTIDHRSQPVETPHDTMGMDAVTQQEQGTESNTSRSVAGSAPAQGTTAGGSEAVHVPERTKPTEKVHLIHEDNDHAEGDET